MMAPHLGLPLLSLIFISLAIITVLRHRISSWVIRHFLSRTQFSWEHAAAQQQSWDSYRMPGHVSGLRSLLWMPMSNPQCVFPSQGAFSGVGSLPHWLGRITVQPRPFSSDTGPWPTSILWAQGLPVRWGQEAVMSWRKSGVHTSSLWGPLILLVFTILSQKCFPK